MESGARDPISCVTLLRTDPRTINAGNIARLFLVVISNAKMQVDDANTHIGQVSRKYNGPNGKRRINFCRKNYKTASALFQNSWYEAQKNKLSFAKQHALVATNDVNQCEDGWKKGGPVQKSPFTVYTNNVNNTNSVIDLIVRKQLGGR
ncbi:hypothetical protein EUTSA_v10017377mg [Eutrema salsugineum]|uniref:Pectinesterase inhibitor domain-containing protein n=1 Tax=Eutrema salsugineum TaxID=72664 RepID=V4NXS7_EUTSA|nr:hypothetical protein EUTSA_v10017377mg [Eutrema salsugineum]